MNDITNGKYRQFFEIDEKYFPCIDDSAIEAGAPWENTYPHEKFIQLLKAVERMLGGSTKRSVWIHGAYGTGKSQCAYALKRMLEVPEEELRAYWDRFDSLKDYNDLLERLLGHKDRNIITAYRYASGDISTPRELFYAIQESVRKAIDDNPKIKYHGENTLKESVIAWLEDESHRNFFDALLKKPEWSGLFTQSNSTEVVNTLKKSSNIKSLMDNIFLLAEKEGITAMSLDADKLKEWLKDVISKNNAKIVFVWDEFSGYFRNNRNSLDEFQKVVALCQEAPFYLIVVTHQTDSIINSEDQSWSVVRQRFDFVEITLPDNIAFELIGHAFNIKPAAKDTWEVYAEDFNEGRLNESRREVMRVAKINDPNIIKKIMPIHPMAALVLKNIAAAFQSNQRSMFDFIKTSNPDDKAFQWFIENMGPTDDYPLLTIDMLWDFFYEKGRDHLTTDIRMILDTYPQQKNLRDDEQRVLKTILIMQAIDKRLGGAIDLLKPTEQNINYAFEGIVSGLDVRCKNIAKALNESGILVLNPIGNNKYAYGAAVLAGDQAKIDEYKKTVRNSCTTEKLVSEGNLETALSLSSALKLRYTEDVTTGALIPVTSTTFTREITRLRERNYPWLINAVIAFAKDDTEASMFRKTIKEAAQKEENKNIVIIDALSSPLGEENLDSYIEFQAMAQYYQGNNNQSARENSNKANQILKINWKQKVYNGNFIVYYDKCPEGEHLIGAATVSTLLQSIVLSKYPYAFDFNRGLTENQLRLTQGKAAAKCGIDRKTNGVVINAERSVLPDVWLIDEYWKNKETSSKNISIIKRDVEELVSSNFERDGEVSIGEIYDLLETKYGFAPCNLSAFLTGFLLKEYSTEPYRFTDTSGGHDSMTSDKLAEMIYNYINKQIVTYIVKMTPEEKAFYELTELVWDIPQNTCSSASQAGIQVKNKMQRLGLPIWSLEKKDTQGVYSIVKEYIDLVKSEGSDAHKVAISIGNAYINDAELGNKLKDLISIENCQSGMMSFLKEYQSGKLLTLAQEIGATGHVISDISNLFSVEFSSLWNLETGEEQVNHIIVEYEYVKATNQLLNSSADSRSMANQCWKDQIEFFMCSHEAISNKYPELSKVIEFLLKIYLDNDVLPDQLKDYTDELLKKTHILKEYIDNEYSVFSDVYSAYLEELSTEDIPKLRSTEMQGIFRKSRTESNTTVKNAVANYLKNQAKTQMYELWKKKTSTKSPSDWSTKNRTPILLMVSISEYDDAKRAFDTLNRSTSSDLEIKSALEYLKNASFYDDLKDKEKINSAFSSLLGRYKSFLTDYERVRDSLDKLQVDAYDWNTNPKVADRIKELAQAEYDAGGSDKVIEHINQMDSQLLKDYLIEQVKANMNLGAEIISGEK